MVSDVQSFIKEALDYGLPKKDIRAALKKAQWSEEEINSALDTYANVDFPIPVPKPKPYLSAREAFLYLVLFLCLYLSAFSFGSLLFEFITNAFPDILRPYEQYNISTVRFATSALIVTFPLYIFLTAKMRTEMKKDTEKQRSKIRKWLTYLTLFVAAGVLIGDAITLLFNLLGGELTLRFILKVGAIALIAGLIFGYYLWELRNEEK